MLLALPFLFVVVLALPALGWLGLRQARAGSAESIENVPVGAVALQIAVVQTFVAGLAALAVFGAGLEIPWGSELSPLTFGLAWLLFGAMVFVAFLEARRPLGPEEALRRRMRKISAGNPTWVGVTVYAGIVEEFAYRGVLTLLLASLLGYWPAALVSAVLFSLAHLSAGKRAVIFGIPFALAMQVLVWFSGGLVLAIIVHAAYDLVAAWLGHRLDIRERDPVI